MDVNGIFREYKGYAFYLSEKNKGGGKNVCKLCLFGRGGFGQAAANELLKEDIPVAYFIDNDKNKIGKPYRGIECVPLEYVKDNVDNYFILITMANPQAVIKQLRENGIECFDVMATPYKLNFDHQLKIMGAGKIQEKIEKVNSLLEDEKSRQVLQNIVKSWYCDKYEIKLFEDIYEENQYFSKDIVGLDHETVFVDCGAYIGDLLQCFIKNLDGKQFKKAILFEMSEQVCEVLRQNIKAEYDESVRDKITIINKGVSDENAEISYVSSISSSHIGKEGIHKGQVVRLDEELAGEKISMIKMDIEGCEMDALMGCVDLIKKNKPILAICVYHKLSDIWEIPLFLKELVPGYKLYLRHYTHTQTETVCYAVYDKPKKNILISGASSFIARHLIKLIDKEKYNVTAVVRKCTEEQQRSDEIKYIELDMEGYKNLDKYADACDIYLPFSWNGAQRECRNNEAANRDSFVYIMDSIRCVVEKLGCSKVILPGSLLEYKNQHELIDENTPCEPVAAYGKYKHELYKEAYRFCGQMGISLIEVRLFSVYGYDDSDVKMINSVMKKLLKNERVSMTKAEQIWGFIHVDDVAGAFVKLIETDVESGCYNLASNEHRPLKDYIEDMKRITGSKSELGFGDIPYSSNEVPHVICNMDKIQNSINWTPEISFDNGIKEMMQHYVSVQNKKKKAHKVIEIDSGHLELPQNTEKIAKERQKMYKGNAELVTIAVFAYGRLEKTRNCVESILKYTTEVPYKLLLIDNGSPEDDVFHYFQSVEYDNTEIIRVNKNVGGIFAVNAGAKATESEFYALLNNDVVVTKDWLKNMMICAQSDQNIGMVCPVGSNVSWEQLEELGGFSSLEEMQEKAAAYNISDPMKWEERIRLVPLVALYRKECFDLAGAFDIGYQHNFGDDDHCFRIRRAGYKLVLCRDVFIHHDHVRDYAAMQGEEGAENVISREAFRNKFYGIDAWDDTQNIISIYIQGLEVTDDGDAKILGFEAKCGAPILDIKNLCRWGGIGHVTICTATEQPMYYPDLRSISDEVLFGDIQSVLDVKEGQFNFIYCGKEINLYHKPLELLKKLAKRVKKGGYLIIKLRNTFDFRAFLQMLGIGELKDTDYPVKISYMDVIAHLQSLGLTLARFYNTPYNVEGQLRDCIVHALSGIGGAQEVAAVMDNLMIEEYIIIMKG